MTVIMKVLLALAIASSTLAIPSKTIVVEPEVKVDPLPRIVESVKIPLALIEIAKCESGNRQYDKDGNVVRGIVNRHDIGRFQINEIYHGEKALQKGWDIFTEEGNLKMATYLYRTQGLKPWEWSKKCWGSQISNI